MVLGDDVVSSNVLKEVKSSFAHEPIETLRQRLAEDGYLCLRGLIPREAVLKARAVMLEAMRAKGAEVLDPDSSFEQPKGAGASFLGVREVTHHPDFLGAVEHPRAYEFFEKLFGEPALSFDYKWARAVPEHGAGTQAHMDYVYMGRGSERLHTMWTPMGDIERENGPMALLEKSHQHSELNKVRETYGQMDVDRDLIQGFFSNDFLSLSESTKTSWLVGDYEAGDVVVMGMHMMHGSFKNQLQKIRLTCDVRFQPASDPVDERWVGESPIAHESSWKALDEGRLKSIEEARAGWGI